MRAAFPGRPHRVGDTAGSAHGTRSGELGHVPQVARLHTTGIAQEFDMAGSSSVWHYDPGGPAPNQDPLPQPDEPGREGDRTDPVVSNRKRDRGSLMDTSHFVLPSEEAERYTGRLIRKGTEMIGNSHPEEKGYRPAAAFGHLGLPEPETLVQGLRKIRLCPDDLTTPEGTYLQRCVDLFTHEREAGTTRIYVRSTIEPSTKPPVSKTP